MKKTLLKTKTPKTSPLKKFFILSIQLGAVLMLSHAFAVHQTAGAADLAGLHSLRHFAEPQHNDEPEEKAAEAPAVNVSPSVHAEKETKPSPVAPLPMQAEDKAKALWSAAALLARPLLFEHEDCDLFQGKKKVGNFGVFWPKRIELPVSGAFRRYVKSEKEKVAFIVDYLGAGVEKNLTLYQMAQVYSFVHNTTVASGQRALAALKTHGMKAAQAVMSRVDRIKGMKTPLRGLADRRKDEVKLGEGKFDLPLSRVMNDGHPHTLASLQQHYNEFVTHIGAPDAVVQPVSTAHATGPVEDEAADEGSDKI